jgi:N utilization substance protein A
VPFSEDLADFVAKALSPAKVSQVILSDDATQADVIVPDHQLSLAIGREGQNARLAARLTGVRIDIRSETQLAEGVPAGGEEEEVEYADGQWVANKETGEMEWHAADGSVISESAWQQQQSAQAAVAAEAAQAPPPVADAAAPAPPSGADVAADTAAPTPPATSSTPEGEPSTEAPTGAADEATADAIASGGAETSAAGAAGDDGEDTGD